MTDSPQLPGVSAEYTTERCERVNNGLLGPSPEVVDLQLAIRDSDMPSEFDISLSSDLDIEISTGCIDSADPPTLREDAERLASALGAGR